MIVKATILAEEISYFFEETIKGSYSDIAWYELLEYSYKYYKKEVRETQIVNYLESVFGFDGKKHFDVVENRANKRLKKLQKVGIGNET